MSQVDYDLFRRAIAATIEAAAAELPEDVSDALRTALEKETGEAARSALDFIVQNIEMSRESQSPICQDTGYPTFWIELPESWDRARVAAIVREEVAAATHRSALRPNAVDIITGKNSGDNTGILVPAVYFEDADGDKVKVKLILKGGGSENVSAQYKLPMGTLGAGRDLEGVRKVVLHGMFEAQGFGCGPGIIGVAIGGDRAQGYSLAKKQLMRPLSDRSPIPELGALEETLHRQGNELDVGAMGFGGATTVLGVKIAAAHRHPASYFVTIAYGCWALRRKVMVLSAEGFTVSDH
jgi:fumarate hydratase class I